MAQRLKFDVLNPRRGQVADGKTERMIGGDRLPKGHDKQAMGVVDPTPQRGQNVQGGSISPMDIFNNQDRRSHRSGREFPERLEHSRPIIACQRIRKPGLIERHVQEWAERSGGEEIIARAPQDEGILRD